MIAAGKEEIRKWFETGVNEGRKCMLVIFDRISGADDSDVPRYYGSAEEAEEALSEYSGEELYKVAEIYDLTSDPQAQLAEKRAWHLPGRPADGEKTADVLYSMAAMMYEGEWPIYKDGDKDPAREKSDAVHWFEETAKLGHTLAALRLGYMYSVGEGVEKNFEKAAEMLKTAAAGGQNEAFEMLSLFYRRGLGVKRSDALAAYWAKRAAADSDYWPEVARRIRDNKGRSADGLFGYLCLKKAAENGEEWAEALIAEIIDDNEMPITREEADALLSGSDA